MLCSTFQHHRPLHHIHPVDWSDSEAEYDGIGGADHVPRAAVRGQHPTGVPRPVPGTRDEGVPSGGGPLRQASVRVQVAGDPHHLYTVTTATHRHSGKEERLMPVVT